MAWTRAKFPGDPLKPANPVFVLRWQDTSIRIRVLSKETDKTIETVSRLLNLPIAICTENQATDLIVHEIGTTGWSLESREDRQNYSVWADMVGNLIMKISAWFLRHTRYLLLHCAAIAWEGQLVLCAAPSRVGKSTLALNAWREGWVFVGDDIVAIDMDLQFAYPFPKAMKPRLDSRSIPKAINHFLPEADRLIAKLNGEYRLLIGRELPRMAGYDQAYCLQRLYLMERDKHSPSRLGSMSRDTALQALLEQVLPNQPTAPMQAIRLFKALWAKGGIYQLHVGEHDLSRALDIIRPPANRPGG